MGGEEGGRGGDATGAGETEILRPRRQQRRRMLRRCYIPSEIFKLPRIMPRKMAVSHHPRRLTVVVVTGSHGFKRRSSLMSSCPTSFLLSPPPHLESRILQVDDGE